jgi:hypothetical protein
VTLGIAIAGFGATLAAAFGAATIGGRLQRSSDIDNLRIQLQIEVAAKFIAAVGDFTIGYAQSNKPRVEDLTPTDQYEAAFMACIALKSATAAVAIVGPDERRTGIPRVRPRRWFRPWNGWRGRA